MAIPRFSADAPIDEIAAALEESGCVVVTDALDANGRDTIRSELAPHMETVKVAADDSPEDFYPGRTRRSSALVARSAGVGEITLDPHTRALCDRFLTPNSEFGYQLHVSAALEIGPGAREQILHREEDSFTFFAPPRPNMILASMWAISDFRADNGGTLVVPGSHKWTEDRVAQPDEIYSAEMPAGSVLYWLGGLLHGAGANTSDDWRYGVILTYSLGWLRQEENQYLDVPPEVAASLSPELKQMLGYGMYRALGFSLDRRIGELPD